MAALRPEAPPNPTLAIGGGPVALPQSWQNEPSYFDRVIVPAPAAGASSSDVFNVPGDSWVKLHAARAQYVADANVANRLVSIRYRDAQSFANILYEAITPINITAGQTAVIEWAIGINELTAVAQVNQKVALPEMIMAPGMQFRMQFQGVQVGDQASAIVLTVERWRSRRAWQTARRPVA